MDAAKFSGKKERKENYRRTVKIRLQKIRICSGHGGTLIVESNEWKEQKLFAEELKRQWKLLWRERIDDKVRAEGIAGKDFHLLFVERGTIIIATRDFKLLDFKQILEQHNLIRTEDTAFPNPSTGGWGKFAREVFGKNNKTKRRASFEKPKGVSGGPLKKCGRGWLHVRM